MSSGEEPASGDALATVELKSAAKWLIGASASTAAAIVAGLQLTNLEKLGKAGWWLGLLALAAISLALWMVFRVLYQAALVLGASRPSIETLANRDRQDNGNFPDGPRLEQPSSALIKELVVLRRTELLGPERDAIGSLIADYTHVGMALTRVQSVRIQNWTYDPAVPTDAVALQGLTAELERRIRHVSDAAERFEADQNYQRLKGQLIRHGVVFVVGVFAFAWLTFLYPHTIPETTKITTPVQVEVVVPSERAATRAGLEKTCAGRVLTGAIVGGTLDAPTVVTRAQEGCPAHRLEDSQDLIVVPTLVK